MQEGAAEMEEAIKFALQQYTEAVKAEEKASRNLGEYTEEELEKYLLRKLTTHSHLDDVLVDYLVSRLPVQGLELCERALANRLLALDPEAARNDVVLTSLRSKRAVLWALLKTHEQLAAAKADLAKLAEDSPEHTEVDAKIKEVEEAINALKNQLEKLAQLAAVERALDAHLLATQGSEEPPQSAGFYRAVAERLKEAGDGFGVLSVNEADEEKEKNAVWDEFAREYLTRGFEAYEDAINTLFEQNASAEDLLAAYKGKWELMEDLGDLYARMGLAEDARIWYTSTLQERMERGETVTEADKALNVALQNKIDNPRNVWADPQRGSHRLVVFFFFVELDLVGFFCSFASGFAQ
ncbi:hypothetical protein T484DRAFT_1779870 [Baffinella frigidus]|nr:hypothetical protein T484DRAFT_1779870 [Cryptophyta sp. CCMP2293]